MGDMADYYVDLAINAEFDRPRFEEPVDKDIWYQSNGEPILIKDMTDSHLINCIKKIKRQEIWRREYYPLLMKELESRKSKQSN